MNLTPHFSLAEFVASAKALQLGIDNSLPDELLPAARETAEMLERIRAFLSRKAGRDVPVLMSSGYRCLLLNRALGSKDGGDHPRAQAGDWCAPSFGTPYEVCKALAPHVVALGIGQLIYERPVPGKRWVHTSTRVPAKPVNRVITITPGGPLLGIQEA